MQSSSVPGGPSRNERVRSARVAPCGTGRIKKVVPNQSRFLTRRQAWRRRVPAQAGQKAPRIFAERAGLPIGRKDAVLQNLMPLCYPGTGPPHSFGCVDALYT